MYRHKFDVLLYVNYQEIQYPQDYKNELSLIVKETMAHLLLMNNFVILILEYSSFHPLNVYHEIIEFLFAASLVFPSPVKIIKFIQLYKLIFWKHIFLRF